MHNYRIFSSYKNILKTNPDSLPATAINISMKYIYIYIKTPQRFFVKKKNREKEKQKGRENDGALQRLIKYLMHCIG